MRLRESDAVGAVRSLADKLAPQSHIYIVDGDRVYKRSEYSYTDKWRAMNVSALVSSPQRLGSCNIDGR
jgi:hypothetical protein